jgi:transcription elongation factor Elf1
MGNQKLICDKCKREIKLKQKHTKIVKVEGDIERMYFKCPHCNTKYTISYTDVEFRENIEKIKLIMFELSDKTLSEEKVKELVKARDRLIAKNKEISQGYRKKYEGEV